MTMIEEPDLDYGPADDDLDTQDPDALRGTRGVLLPLHALRLGQALWKVRRAEGLATDTISTEIAQAYGLEHDRVAVLLPVVCRPAWRHIGTRAPWPRLPVKEAKPDAPVGVVHESNVITPLAAIPDVAVKFRALAEKAGWLCVYRWGAAHEAVRALVPNDDGQGKHFEVSLVPTVSLSVRADNLDGRRAYAFWSADDRELEPTWTYRGGGIDGVHGVKITALRKAIRDTDS